MSRLTELALPILRSGSAAIARQAGQLISQAKFLAEIEELAELLPDHPYTINFCSDRYRFTVAWIAAMLRGQITLLPAGHDAGAVASLRRDYHSFYVITDDDLSNDRFAPVFAYPVLRSTASTADKVPAFKPDQIAAVLFTSGSTGQSNPSPRRWGRLVASAISAGKALGIADHAGAAVIATVPHAHSYGLESAVMLPLQHGLLLTAERPFFPADIAAALDWHHQRTILVTTPVHLRALVGHVFLPQSASRLRPGFILSATAPLSIELSTQAEAALAMPLHEIYGCSEAGQLATRRTTEGPVWRCLDGFALRATETGCWASGPYEADVQVADEIELTEGNGFILKGRSADLVNIAGKRSSLAYLNQQLIAVDGVHDGVFLKPEEDAAGMTARLIAVAVAPGLDAATVQNRLRERLEAAFLPRRLYIIDRLPRNDLGKLPRSDILRLIELAKTESSTANSDPTLLHFALDHRTCDGHFPGNPIIPGAVMLDELIHALCPAGWYGEIEAAKFHHPVRPGESLKIVHNTAQGKTRFECRMVGTQKLVLSGILRSAIIPP